MATSLQSIPDVCEVALYRRARGPAAPPTLLLEVAHGATLAQHFTRLRAALVGDYPADLQDFFHVNTDVGAPEVAARVAERFVAARPACSALLVRCLLPRTFVDCNRVIEPDAAPSTSAAGQVTPGLHAWVRDPRDRELLLSRHAAYRATVEAAFAAVCGRGGVALMVHSYAPRSVDVPVDGDIVQHLRAAYQPDRIGTWPLRSPIDLIVADPDGRRLAHEVLAEQAAGRFRAAGFEVAHNAAYGLHPSTLAHAFAVRYAGRTLCLEIRRDLLVQQFTPFREMLAVPEKVDCLAAPLAAAVVAALHD
jgi:predicted N-formylglutamate amidohydrolase